MFKEFLFINEYVRRFLRGVHLNFEVWDIEFIDDYGLGWIEDQFFFCFLRIKAFHAFIANEKLIALYLILIRSSFMK